MKKPAHRFALATSDPDLHASIKKAVTERDQPSAVVLSRTDATGLLEPDGLEQLVRSEANVVLLDIGTQEKATVASSIRELMAQNSDIRVVLLGQPATAPELLDLMRAGVADYLPKPIENGSLEGAIDRATRGLTQVSASPEGKGRVVGLFGPKGGTGVTTIAANVAIKLRELTEQDVLMADLNAELGTASILLGVRPRYNFVELVKNLHRMDDDLLRSYLTRHESGVSFLPSPLTARDLEGVTKQRINATVSLLRSAFGHVLLDLGNSLTPLAQAGLGVCDEVVVVVTPEVPALRNAKRLLPLVGQSLPGGQKSLRFVVNRYDGNVDISLGQMRDTLGHDIAMTLPRADEASSHAANVGRPVVMDGASKYEKAISKLTRMVATPGSIVKRGKKSRGGALFARFRSGKTGADSKGGRRPEGAPSQAPQASAAKS